MPNFSVRDRAVQVAQTGTEEALVRNAGASSVYLDVSSAVSPVSFGIELKPFDSVNWPTGTDLWAVTGTGQTSTLTVLYGATGVSLGSVAAVVTGDVNATISGPVNANITNASIPVTGNVNASITNASIPVTGNVNATITNASIDVDVNGTVPVDIQNATIDATISGDVNVLSGQVNVGGILTPVTVQGGGAGILSASNSLGVGASVNIPVVIPSGDPSYYAYNVVVQVSTAPHATAARMLRYTDTLGNTTNVVQPSLNDFQLGRPDLHRFTIPATNNSFTVTLMNIGTVVLNYVLTVDGTNVSPAQPTTALADLLYRADGPVQITQPASVAIGRLYLPASFQPYSLLVRANTTTFQLVNMSLGYINAIGQLAVWHSRAYNTGTNTVGLDPSNYDFRTIGATAYIPITGNGRVCGIDFPINASNTGNAVYSLNS